MDPLQTVPYQPGEDFARDLDREDPLASCRERFHIPPHENGDSIYFCGNSLGLQPKSTAAALQQELVDWRDLAVHAHFRGKHPWFSYHEAFRDVGARLVGANPGEVVLMNSLTANLHLMMVSFYRPTAQRRKILIEDAAFPSDSYAVKSQLHSHGYDAKADLLVAKPRAGEHSIRTEDIEQLIADNADELALVMLAGVNYYTGQFFDLERITRAGHAAGARVGFDLAHAAGNLPLRLHDWNVDFAVWCNYKYLNSGPGAVAGCFVHERHGNDPELPRFAGWWGNDPEERFKMHLLPEFTPRAGADGWQLSNPPILAMAPVRESYAIFDEIGMDNLRQKAVRLTGYMEALLDDRLGDRVEVLTPRDPAQRGCQLSIRVVEGAKERVDALDRSGVVSDFRAPDVVRVAPVPLYNTYMDVWRFVSILADQVD
ncbi:MAG: kynureninase [Planctomycetota bacterium]